MNKKNRVSLIVLALLSLGVLAACSASPAEAATGTRSRRGAVENSDTTETEIVEEESPVRANQAAGNGGRGSGASNNNAGAQIVDEKSGTGAGQASRGDGRGNGTNSGTTERPGGGQGEPGAALAALPVGELSADEVAGLLYMREEEKLAQDVYLTLYEQWGTTVFQNIANSETTHTESVRTLLERYSLEDPAAGNARGVFTNAELQALYDQLVAQGSESLSSALRVGAAIEEIDILDLEERLAQTTQPDIVQVYQNLMDGSRNHLRAFVSVLEQQTGETYQPQYLSQAVFDEILSEQNGRGRRGGR